MKHKGQLDGNSHPVQQALAPSPWQPQRPVLARGRDRVAPPHLTVRRVARAWVLGVNDANFPAKTVWAEPVTNCTAIPWAARCSIFGVVGFFEVDVTQPIGILYSWLPARIRTKGHLS